MGVVAAEINATQVFCLGDNFYHSSKSGCREGSGICNGGQDGPDGEQRLRAGFVIVQYLVHPILGGSLGTQPRSEYTCMAATSSTYTHICCRLRSVAST